MRPKIMHFNFRYSLCFFEKNNVIFGLHIIFSMFTLQIVNLFNSKEGSSRGILCYRASAIDNYNNSFSGEGKR